MTPERRQELDEQARRAIERMAHKETVIASVIDRDVCFGCGCRADLHDEFGCKRYR